MSPQARREVLKAVRPRYRKANRQEKKLILDEFVAVTGYHRKYAIQLLNHGAPATPKERRKRRRTYPVEVISALVKIWDILDRPCGKRLKPYLLEIVEVLERHQELVLDQETKALLLRMSHSTMPHTYHPELNRAVEGCHCPLHHGRRERGTDRLRRDSY